MKAAIYARIAAVLIFIHSALHAVGSVIGKPEPGAQQAAVSAMKSNQFLLMGFHRSYWDFYMGLSIGGSIFMAIEAVVLWQITSLAKTNPTCLRPIYATFLVGYLLVALNSYTYFFWPPVIMELLISLCLALAILASKPTPLRSLAPSPSLFPSPPDVA